MIKSCSTTKAVFFACKMNLRVCVCVCGKVEPNVSVHKVVRE